MEDGVKERCKEPAHWYKAGWLKKDTGRLLPNYKDCYVHVEKTELVVYENEEIQTCLERFDLENYDKCRELKNPFTRKQRLILIKSQKPGNKVHDVKLQAQNAEEKETWMKALRDAINRAKNKYLDEVKTDKSLNLEHITRTRPKGNNNRRPPTRIHMKEVAIVSEDGTMYLDLDRVDAVSSNGTHPDYANIESSAEAMKSPTSSTNVKDSPENQLGPCSEEEKTEQDISLVKKKFKPPMPPTKEARPSATPVKNDQLIDKDLETSMCKSPEIQPCVSIDEATEKDETLKISEASLDLKSKTDQPTTPTIPPKNESSSPEETSQTRPSDKPPAVPCKGKKPILWIVKPDEVVHKTTDEIKNLTNSKTESESSGAQEHVSEEVSEETVGITIAPLIPPKKTQDKITELSVQPIVDQTSAMLSSKVDDPSTVLTGAQDTTDILVSEKEVVTKNEVRSECVFLDDAIPDNFNHSTVLSHFPENSKEGEEKPADSGQHSDDGTVGSGSKDTLAAAMKKSQLGLDVSDGNEDDMQILDHTGGTQAEMNPQVGMEEFLCQVSVLNPPIKPLVMARSASHGDLLLPSSVNDTSAVTRGTSTPKDDVAKLKLEVSIQVEKTNELLSRLSKLPNMGTEEDRSVNLLAETMEKLKRADLVLTEGNELSPSKNEINRKSW